MIRKSTIQFAAVAFLMALGALWISLGEQPTEVAEGTGEPLFPDAASRVADIDTLHIAGPSATTTLNRSDGAWSVAERGGYGADAAKVGSLLRGLARAQRKERKTANPELLPRIGLGEDGTRIEAVDRDGEVIAALTVGSSVQRGADNAQWAFVRLPDEDHAWLVDPFPQIDASPSTWLETSIADIPRSRLDSVEGKPTGGPGYVIRAESDPLPETRLEGLAAGEEGDPLRISAIAGALGGLKFEDVREAGPGSDGAVLLYRMRDGLEVTVRLNIEDAAPADDEFDYGPGKAYWARLEAAYRAPENPDPDAPDIFPDALADGAAEAKKLSARWRGWSYRLPDILGEDLVRPRAELIRGEN